MKKPAWVIEKERARRTAMSDTVWLFGLHAVRDALCNPARTKLRLLATPNAAGKLAQAITASGLTPEISDPRKFSPPIEPGSVHQGAVLEALPLDWGDLETRCGAGSDRAPRVLLLDRVSDPHNVGAVLRSSEVLGARAVVAPMRHAAPETGALAKAASGALERQPYLRVRNLATAMQQLKEMGYTLLGLASEAETDLDTALAPLADRPLGLVLGAEGPGLRPRTREICDQLASIPAAGPFGSLNVSNAAAIALYAATRGR